MKPSRSVPALVLLGVLLVQAAWVLAVPPFRNLDEFDHAYRASAVARGEWLPHGTPLHGRGGLVTVPRDIVEAAHDQCAKMEYNGHDNCNPVAEAGDDQVRVASAASRYNPVFYWVVGTPSLLFDGSAALYAMRVTAAVLCALGLAAAAWCLTRGTVVTWPRAGLLLALTPVFLYSTTVPAANGLEMVAGLTLWVSLLSIRSVRRQGDTLALSLGVVAAVVLVTLRSLGPLWALLVVLCVVVARRRELAAIWRTHARGIVVGTALTTTATLASVWWVLAQGPLAAANSDGDFSHVSYTVIWPIMPLGMLQTIAAFPYPQESAPAVVYVVWFAIMGGFLTVALRSTRGVWRQSLVVGLILSQVLPVVLSVVALRQVGLVWQGRYALPFVAGLAVVAAIGLHQAGVRPVGPRLGGLIVLALTTSQVVSVAHVFHHEAGSALGDDPNWIRTSTWFVAVLMTLGYLVVVRGLMPPAAGSRTELEPEQERAPVSV